MLPGTAIGECSAAALTSYPTLESPGGLVTPQIPGSHLQSIPFNRSEVGPENLHLKNFPDAAAVRTVL